jgi:16S rRNA (guanine527-N7)-methyltransferase
VSTGGAEADQLVRGAAALGVRLEPAAAAILVQYVERLYAWNRSAGLTTVARADAVRLHLLDSLSIVPLLPERGSIADLGSGAGLPGIPVAAVLRCATVTLVESKRRKASFLAETVRDLALGNCQVVEADAHSLVFEARAFDAVTARAFLPPAGLVGLGAALVRPGGRVVVMGGRRNPQVDDAASAAGLMRAVEHLVRLPGGTEHRRVLAFDKPTGT